MPFWWMARDMIFLSFDEDGVPCCKALISPPLASNSEAGMAVSLTHLLDQAPHFVAIEAAHIVKWFTAAHAL
ncbi:hypothetical protein [Bradyrhizobium sp. LTSPM299]|uniref:hypothetical protein n=1 Tax=Bradyrhizobium sp. LTSPM299 TaxID=1619233 RepID=UPI0012E269AF|nr:hypothetical protein [Bradyrhizobium sp. LTSPM299]